jgi:PBSX family phage terminase large subunit
MVDFTNSIFSPKALDFITNSTARINIAHGSVRSGKTIDCSVRWLNYIQTGPQGDLVMLGKTIATLQRNVLNDIFDIVGPKNYRWRDKIRGELEIYGRRIYCYGASNEEAESKIRGATFAGALCDECNLYPQSVWQQLMARLSVKGAQCFCNCNPDSPYHWFYTDYITNDEIVDKKVWHFTMDDNPNLDPDYVEALKRSYRGVWYDRMIRGLWVAAEGRIYDMFDKNVHMVDTLSLLPRASTGKLSPGIEWYVACDYGTASVMSWGLYARVPSGARAKYYKIREYYYDAEKERSQHTDSEFADIFDGWLRSSLPENISPHAIRALYCDPSAVSWKLELSRRGYRVLNADNDVINGIRTVGSALSLGEYFIDRSCKNTELEYANYTWDRKAQLQGIDKPIKFKDHTCDTDRYAIYTSSLGSMSGVYN